MMKSMGGTGAGLPDLSGVGAGSSSGLSTDDHSDDSDDDGPPPLEEASAQ